MCARLGDALPDDANEAAALVLRATRPRLGRSAAEVLEKVPEEPRWLIPGWLAEGWAVKIAAREKVGKGTFVLLMLGALERGERTPFGPPADPTTALVLTEEPEDSMREKLANAGLTRATVVYGWELAGMTWEEKVAAVVDEAVERGHRVVFADNVSRAAEVEDEAGTELARRAEALFSAAKARELAVIVDHHHRKAAGRTEDKSRGTTALAGATDCNVEMEVVGSVYESRVRRLSSRGRRTSTNWTRTIVLAEDGRSYEGVADDQQPQRAEDRRRLRVLVKAGDTGVTAPGFGQAIERREDAAGRVLEEFVAEGWATVEGMRPKLYRVTEAGCRAAEGAAAGGLDSNPRNPRQWSMRVTRVRAERPVSLPAGGTSAPARDTQRRESRKGRRLARGLPDRAAPPCRGRTAR